MVFNYIIKFYVYIKYCIVGLIGAFTEFTLYTILVKYFYINYLIANIFISIIALIIVYLLQKNWTFQYVSNGNSKEFKRYLISVVIAYILNNGTLFLLVGIFGFNAIIAKIIQIILGTSWGYALMNYYVFPKEKKSL